MLDVATGETLVDAIADANPYPGVALGVLKV